MLTCMPSWSFISDIKDSLYFTFTNLFFSHRFVAMKIQVQPLIVILALNLFAWVDCANTPSCASMTSWFPGTSPASFADNLPYQLSVSGYVPHGKSVPVYPPASSHIGKKTNKVNYNNGALDEYITWCKRNIG